MKKGHLSQYFEKVAAKRLSTVEVDTAVSHQHELNGSKTLKELLGTFDGGDIRYYPTKFFWLAEENETVTAEGNLSWYDSRYKQPHRSAEWRLFYPSNDVFDLASEGDLIILALRPDSTLMCIITAAGSTLENQLLWLFNVPVQVNKEFPTYKIEDKTDKEVDFIVRLILDELGIEPEDPDAGKLDGLLEKFNKKFPTTREFSAFARQTFGEVDPINDPDLSIVSWMNHEEKLFRRLERHIVSERLEKYKREGKTDVDNFLEFSMSVLQRRKSRAGYALELHLEEIFKANKIRYSIKPKTEMKSRPDFLLPDIKFYFDDKFPIDCLTLLGVKTTLKDRWRQVLAEGDRIENKHLLTLEPGISVAQTDEMHMKKMQLVVPLSIHSTFLEEQLKEILSVKVFLDLLMRRQEKAGV
jgi:EcoRII C terminal